MKLHLLGVRGSTPCPGADFVAVGGHTSCVAFARGSGPPTLVIDAGTGLRDLRSVLGGAPFSGTLLLGHLHWDHTQGLPFCAAMDHPDGFTDVRIPAQGRPVVEVFERALSPPHFPIATDGLRGRWSFEELEEGWHEIEGFRVLAAEIPHKGGRTFGYRIEADGAAVAYLSDHAPQQLGPGPSGVGAHHDAAVSLASGVDVLIHDAQYTRAELATRGGWGHAAADYAAELGQAVAAARVLLFHHDPARTDAEVDQLTAEVARRHPAVVVEAARQHMSIDLAGVD